MRQPDTVVQQDKDALRYRGRFSWGESWLFILSAMLTFRLANAYMTNLVKCGLSNREARSRGISHYKDETVVNCYFEFLQREIQAMAPRIIFAIGPMVAKWVTCLAKDNYAVQQLPHPVDRRCGFRDEDYIATYFWHITKALHNAGVVDAEEGSRLAQLYLTKIEMCNK